MVIGVFVYALVSYIVAMGGLVWFILFQGDFLLPATVNSGVSVPFSDGLIINLGLLMLWGVQHSVMARPAFKERLTSLIPESAVRSTYVWTSGLCLALIALYWQGNAEVIWNFDALKAPLRILSLAGWALTTWATSR